MSAFNTSVTINPVGPDEIDVNIQYAILMHVEQGIFSCIIPGFDIVFSAKDESAIDKKAATLVKSTFDHFLIHTEKNKLKSLALELHKLGFKSHNDMLTMRDLVNNKLIKAKFKPGPMPLGVAWDNAQTSNKQLEMKLAVA